MAHQFPQDYREKGSETEQADQQAASSSFLSNSLQDGDSAPRRSTPIAIRESKRNDFDTSDSEDEDGDNVVELDALRLDAVDGRFSGEEVGPRSLPSRLLRAPFLGSVPSNEDFISYHNMLPPPMNLQEAPTSVGTFGASTADKGPSYGSLRESHMRGVFQDGPSSYRDARTGGIRRLHHRVRFSDTSPSSAMQALSIGERMIQSRRQKSETSSEDEESSKEPTSTLAAMLEASGSDSAFQAAQAGEETTPVQLKTLHDEDEEFQMRSANMLSTSLTGLELLQRGFRTSPALSGLAHVSEEEELPRDAQGHNALLSRSISDPTPRIVRRQALPMSPLLTSSSTNPSPRFQPSHLQPLNALPPAAASFSGGNDVYQANLLPHGIESTAFPQEPSDHNPDMEEAFDMDI